MITKRGAPPSLALTAPYQRCIAAALLAFGCCPSLPVGAVAEDRALPPAFGTARLRLPARPSDPAGERNSRALRVDELEGLDAVGVEGSDEEPLDSSDEVVQSEASGSVQDLPTCLTSSHMEATGSEGISEVAIVDGP